MYLRGKKYLKLEKSPRKKALILLKNICNQWWIHFSIKNSVILSNGIIYAFGTYSSHMEISLRFCSVLLFDSLQYQGLQYKMREFVMINHSVQLLICKTWSWDCF